MHGRISAGQNFGTYRLTRLLAVGGMSEVWLAETTWAQGIRKQVAIKILLGLKALDKNVQRWFRNEAMLGGLISHPNLVQVIDFVEESDGAGQKLFAIVMEYVDGYTLSDLISMNQSGGGRIPPEVILNLSRQICEGLQCAHSARDDKNEALGVIHRDLKPSNFLISQNGILKIADFGVARTQLSSNATDTGLVPGTLRYMSPEQALGGLELDCRSDLFSLGLVLYEAVTLEPFHDLDGVALQQALDLVGRPEARRRLAALADDEWAKPVLPIIAACLRPSRNKRPTSAKELSILIDEQLYNMPTRPDVAGWLGGLNQGNFVTKTPTLTLPLRKIPSTGSYKRLGAGLLLLLTLLLGWMYIAKQPRAELAVRERESISSSSRLQELDKLEGEAPESIGSLGASPPVTSEPGGLVDEGPKAGEHLGDSRTAALPKSTVLDAQAESPEASNKSNNTEASPPVLQTKRELQLRAKSSNDGRDGISRLLDNEQSDHNTKEIASASTPEIGTAMIGAVHLFPACDKNVVDINGQRYASADSGQPQPALDIEVTPGNIELKLICRCVTPATIKRESVQVLPGQSVFLIWNCEESKWVEK